ncbi:MAG: hypothetical protein KDA22_12580 [Phycisphaerales bacterium]|nr:hypothetical protein [Phycisphaerales bacterium]
MTARLHSSMLVSMSVALVVGLGGARDGADGSAAVGAAPPPAAEPPPNAPDYPRLGREIVELVRENFLDADRAEQWAALNGAYAADIADPETFARDTRRVLSLLGASHTAYYTIDDPEHAPLEDLFGAALGKPAVRIESIGADLRADGVVRVVFRGGPADIAGLRRGDRVLAVGDMERFHPVRSFRGRAGERVRLTVAREPAAPPIDVVVVPRLIQPRREWVEASERGAALHASGGKTIATLPLYACAGEDANAIVRAAIAGPFREADALVLDLREGWGGCNPDFLDLFSTLPPRLEQRFRNGEPVVIDDQWRKPLVVLVNERTRSGKEVVARTIQRKGVGVVVGERTAGAVLGGRVFPLSDGSLLFLAVADIAVDGERLEGVGVEPDVTVADDLGHTGGRDPQLERAIEVAAELVGTGG